MTQNNDTRDLVGTVAHMKKKGSLKLLVIALSVGAALFFIGSITVGEGKRTGETAEEGESTELVDFFEYKSFLEEEIERICMEVSGVNNVRVVAFFSEVGGSLYAQNSQSGGASGSEKNEYVIIGSGSSAHALYLGESLPRLSGIGVVCDTGGDQGRRNELLSLLSSAYGLPMTRIYVTEAGD